MVANSTLLLALQLGSGLYNLLMCHSLADHLAVLCCNCLHLFGSHRPALCQSLSDLLTSRAMPPQPHSLLWRLMEAMAELDIYVLDALHSGGFLGFSGLLEPNVLHIVSTVSLSLSVSQWSDLSLVHLYFS